MRVRLPAAGLVLERTVRLADDQAPPTMIRHEVRFVGLLGPLFAVLLGRRFRELLPPTLEALVRLTDEPSPVNEPSPAPLDVDPVVVLDEPDLRVTVFPADWVTVRPAHYQWDGPWPLRCPGRSCPPADGRCECQ